MYISLVSSTFVVSMSLRGKTAMNTESIKQASIDSRLEVLDNGIQNI